MYSTCALRKSAIRWAYLASAVSSKRCALRTLTWSFAKSNDRLRDWKAKETERGRGGGGDYAESAGNAIAVKDAYETFEADGRGSRLKTTHGQWMS